MILVLGTRPWAGLPYLAVSKLQTLFARATEGDWWHVGRDADGLASSQIGSGGVIEAVQRGTEKQRVAESNAPLHSGRLGRHTYHQQDENLIGSPQDDSSLASIPYSTRHP